MLYSNFWSPSYSTSQSYSVVSHVTVYLTEVTLVLFHSDYPPRPCVMCFPACPPDVRSVFPTQNPVSVTAGWMCSSCICVTSPSISGSSSSWFGVSSFRLSSSFSLSSCFLLLWCLQVFLLPEPLQVFFSGVHLLSTSLCTSSGSCFTRSEAESLQSHILSNICYMYVICLRVYMYNISFVKCWKF